MILKKLALALTYLVVSASSCQVEVDEDIEVDIPPPSFDNVGLPLFMDTYSCVGADEFKADIIFAPGAPLFLPCGSPGGKNIWSELSTLRGYRVSVLERPVEFAPLSLVLPSDFDRTIEYLGTDTAVIGGHSFGGSQALLRNAGVLPPFPLTIFLPPGATPFTQPPNPSIKGAMVSGAAIFAPIDCDGIPDGLGPEPPNEPPCSAIADMTVNNQYQVPTLMLYGEGERLVADPQFNIFGDSGGLGSYNNQAAPKAFAILAGCDHNSLLDTDLTFVSNIVNSTLCRKEQISRNFQVMIKFLKTIGLDGGNGGKAMADYCTILPNGKVADCLSEEA